VAIIVEIYFDKDAFSLNAIKKAAYRFIDKFSMDLKIEESKYFCTLRFNENKTENSANLILEEFRKEVLDQDLRELIKAETEDIRNLILAHAFSKTSLIQHE
jgi:His-Xaa-Ser system protein HxsD